MRLNSIYFNKINNLKNSYILIWDQEGSVPEQFFTTNHDRFMTLTICLHTKNSSYLKQFLQSLVACILSLYSESK